MWDAKDLSLKKELDFPKPVREGWGLVKRNDKEEGKDVLNFYITDGSHRIYVVDGEAWKTKRIIEVRRCGY